MAFFETLQAIGYHALQTVEVILEAPQLADSIGISLVARVGGLRLCFSQDGCSLLFGGLPNGVLMQQTVGSFLRPSHNLFSLTVGQGQDAIALLLKRRGSLDLLWDGNAHLVEQVEQCRTLDQNAVRQRHPPTLRDQLIEPVNQLSNIDLAPPRVRRHCGS